MLPTMYEQDHVVQFYINNHSLLKNLKSFIGGGLLAGDPCVLIATPEHLAALESKLVDHGLNLESYKAAGKYFCLDAATTLASIMRAGRPDQNLSGQVIGKVLEQASSPGKTIRVFGEMVALLATEGNYQAATELEKLWNKLTKQYSFTLFCAYPMGHFSNLKHKSAQKMLGDLGILHGRIITGELYGRVSINT